MRKYFYITFLGLFAFGLTTISVSCRKKEDTIAKITVRDTSNVLVPGARVILQGESTTTPIQAVVRRDTLFTNADGVALFNYNEVYQLGQAGVAVLNIRAEKGPLYGEGIIKIEEEKVSTATVLLRP